MFSSKAGSFSTKVASTTLKTGVWQHLTFTVKSDNGNYYVNGKFLFNGTIFTPRSVSRSDNFIGKSNFGIYGYQANPNAFIDDLKIYNKSLDEFDIYDAYLNNI